MTQSDVKTLEMTMENAKHNIELSEALDRLHDNPDFQKLIIKGYFEDECVRLVHLKGAPNTQNLDRQAAITREIDGIGSLRGYFGSVHQRGEWARDALADSERELEIMEGEEGADE